MKHETEIEIGGTRFRHLITTIHGDVTIRTAIHTTRHPKRQGGVRFVEKGSVEEVAHLAIGMSEKAAAANVPIDGLKCLIECRSGVPESVSDRAALVAEHLRQAVSVDPDIVFGPDMLAPESVLSAVATEFGLEANVTGLTRACGGIDIDGNGLTALGIREAIVSVAPQERLTVNIQGFGAVGAELAKILPANFVVTSVSNKFGLVHNEDGLDVSRYFLMWKNMGDRWIKLVNDSSHFEEDPDLILTIPCDVFVPAARTAVLASADELGKVRTENPNVVAVERMIENGAPRIVAEAANFPITESAESALESAGTLILPDVLVNGGGMIGCWYEYHHRQALLHDETHYQEALKTCRDRIKDTIRMNMEKLTYAHEQGVASRRFAKQLASVTNL